MKEIPENLDWVTVRNECSVEKIFQTLKLQVKEDIERRNESLRAGQKERYRFDITESGGGVFTVFIDGIVRGYSIAFAATKDFGISVRKDGIPILEAIPTVSDDGKCRLKVDGRECELWQVRKMALEDFFFHVY
jgi:hypothetical protein